MGRVILVQNNFADIDQVETNTSNIAKMTALNVVTINPDDWVVSGTGFIATKSVSGMTSTAYPLWYYNGTPTAEQYEAFCAISSMTTSTGSVTFKYEDTPKPDVSLSIMIKGL